MLKSFSFENNPRRWAMHCFFFALFVMAFLLYQERLFKDCAYYIFYVLDSGFFHVEHQRLVLAISQMLPLGGYYLGFSLKAILILYSLGHVLFFYILFLIVLYRYQDEAAAMAIILLQVIGVLILYFSPMMEICYGAGLLVMFYAMLRNQTMSTGKVIALIILEILILTSHPENFVIFFFVLLYDAVQNGIRKSLHFIFALVILGLIIFKSQTFSNYEGGKLNYMLDMHQNTLYKALFTLDLWRDLFKLFWDYYLILMVMVVIIAYQLIRRKDFLLLFFFAGTIFGLLCLINATNPARTYSRYNESLYNPLVPLVVILFMYEVWGRLFSIGRNLVFILLGIVCVHHMQKIWDEGKFLTLRLQQMQNIMKEGEKKGGSKFAVNLANCEQGDWWLTWAYPTETLLISSIDDKEKSKTVYTDEDFESRDTSTALTENNFLLMRWFVRDDDDINPRFFHLQHGAYKQLCTADSTEHIDGGIKISTEKKFELEKGKTTHLPVEITNASSQILHSATSNGNYFTYSLKNKATGEIISGVNTPLEIDVTDTYSQTFSVTNLSASGEYILNLQLLIHNKPQQIEATAEVRVK